jgi:cation:H+ antiporter
VGSERSQTVGNSAFERRVGCEAAVGRDVGEDLLDQRENVWIVDRVDVVPPFSTGADQAGQAKLGQVLAHGGHTDAGALSQSRDVVAALGRQPQHVQPRRVAQQRESARRRRSREMVLVGVGAARLVERAAIQRDAHDSGAVLANASQTARLARDQRWFTAIFVVKVALGLVAFAIKPWLGLLFFAVYSVYFWREIRGGHPGDDEEELAPLKLQPRAARPATAAVLIQTLGALAVIFVSSQIFVYQLDAIGPMLGLSGAVTALLLSPIATELPEIMNAIIWVRQGKTQLALANISGAMMIQATVPSGLGLLFTDWRFDHALLWSGAVTMAAIAYLLANIRNHKLTATRLALSGLLYLVFAAGLVAVLT